MKKKKVVKTGLSYASPSKTTDVSYAIQTHWIDLCWKKEDLDFWAHDFPALKLKRASGESRVWGEIQNVWDVIHFMNLEQ